MQSVKAGNVAKAAGVTACVVRSPGGRSYITPGGGGDATVDIECNATAGRLNEYLLHNLDVDSASLPRSIKVSCSRRQFKLFFLPTENDVFHSELEFSFIFNH